MPHLNFHPAPGFGDLLPGNFVVPQNPIADANDPGTALVPSVQGLMRGHAAYVPHIGELLPAAFAVPQNPIRDALASTSVISPVAGSGQGLSGLGCGCAGLAGCGCAGGLKGLGDFSSTLTSIENTLTTDYGIGSFQIPLWGWIAGGLVLWFIFEPSGSEYRQKRAALRSQYRGYKRAASYVGQYGS